MANAIRQWLVLSILGKCKWVLFILFYKILLKSSKPFNIIIKIYIFTYYHKLKYYCILNRLVVLLLDKHIRFIMIPLIFLIRSHTVNYDLYILEELFSYFFSFSGFTDKFMTIYENTDQWHQLKLSANFVNVLLI